jgi:hypothetical protein
MTPQVAHLLVHFCSAAALPGSTALPFVISTGAQRSGEICGLSASTRKPVLAVAELTAGS